MISRSESRNGDLRISFEFFPPKPEEAEQQLWNTVADLSGWEPEFVSVTYGAGGSTKAPTLSAVRRMIHETPFTTASHLTCVGATREDTHRMIGELLAAGWLDARFEGLDDNAEERAKVAADVAAEQIRD